LDACPEKPLPESTNGTLRESLPYDEEEALRRALAARLEESRTVQEKEQIQENSSARANASQCYYLRSMISHKGNFSWGGHYVCHSFVQDGARWKLFDDESVQETPESEVLGTNGERNGYLFLYVRESLEEKK